MKLPLPLLQRCIELPSEYSSVKALRALLDDLGLEVKAVDVAGEFPIFTIETLANRGDHLSVFGVAREVSARLLIPLATPQLAPHLPERPATVVVRKFTELCSKYALLELQVGDEFDCLRDVGKYLVGGQDLPGIVRVLNFVQLELGQPMHAFDRDKVDGEVHIAVLAGAEEIVALDGKTYTVPEGAIVIRDRNKVIAVAGVIGCANSMVDAGTKRVLIESASFDPVKVRLAARGMGIFTDAAQRFERGSDVDACELALRRVLLLLANSAGTHPLGMSTASATTSTAKVAPIVLELEDVRAELNLPRLGETEVMTRLRHLGFVVEQSTGSGKSKPIQFHVRVPSWRVWDVVTARDLVEEVARAIGYGRVKIEMPLVTPKHPQLSFVEEIREAIEPVLVGSGFIELVTKGFYSNRIVDAITALDPVRGSQHLLVKNSLESAHAAMKVTNIPHLAQSLTAYLRRGGVGGKVFEIGRLYRGYPDRNQRFEYEEVTVSFATLGRMYLPEWGKEEGIEEKLRVFKGIVENICAKVGWSLDVKPSKDPWFHPGYRAECWLGRSRLGVFGVVHPRLSSVCEVQGPLLYGELSLEALNAAKRLVQAPILSDQPHVERDITVGVKPGLPSSAVSGLVKRAAIPHLQDISAVDLFVRDGEDLQRITYRLRFQEEARTLSADEVAVAMEQVREVLGKESRVVVL